MSVSDKALAVFLGALALMLIAFIAWAFGALDPPKDDKAYCARRGLEPVYLHMVGSLCADPKTGALYGPPKPEPGEGK